MTTKSEQSALCLWNEKHELVAVMIKNGSNSFYKCKKFGFDDHAALFEETPQPEAPKGAIVINE